MLNWLFFPITVKDGYQRFKIWPNRLEIIRDGKTQENKFNMVRVFLKDKVARKSVLDIGASNGLFSFLAALEGAKKVVALDNENKKVGGGSLDKLASRARRAGFVSIETINIDYANYKSKPFDIVICLAIMHHLYYLAKLSPMSLLISKISSHTKDLLVIEWIPAKKAGPYKNLKPYTKKEFLRELSSHFNAVKKIGISQEHSGSRPNREIYVCSKKSQI